MAHIQKLNSLLPLVAIGTVADCQSILDPVNRILVKSGLDIMSTNRHQIKGLQALIQASGLQEKLDCKQALTSQDIAFVLSPILNSSGRITHSKLSIQSLISDPAMNNQHAVDPLPLVQDLVAINEDRKALVKKILHEIDNQQLIQPSQSMIWLQGNWNKGIIGLIASRLVNSHQLPIVVVSIESENQATASLRAPEGYHLPQAMAECSELFQKFGGHPGAAGFSCSLDSLVDIRSNLEQLLAKQKQHLKISEVSFVPLEIKNLIDLQTLQTISRPDILWVNPKQIQKESLIRIWQLDPFGQDFPIPRLGFKLSFSELDGYKLFWMGKDKNHVKITLSNQVSLTFFNLEPHLQKLFQTGGNFELLLVTRLVQNVWQGSVRFELMADTHWVL